ncbi:protoporphyrinogen oxidase [Aquibacillus sediminis]|uniref:protoporphyrinogen oxidase n=1 Tax=Aquibacillus sediminis TaxID=2574734 RepID=UPI001107E1A8|nr:protoporphyrinogen oxidase [Aquibacillus sediminis]
MKNILVLGGGVTGLTAAYELQKWKKQQQAEVHLTLAEASSSLGGKIRTVKKDGFVIESGADSLVARKMNDLAYVDELGLRDAVAYNTTGTSFLYTDGELKQIPADAVFGIPTSVKSLEGSALVSDQGKVTALADLYTKNETFTEEDSIGEFLEYFLGKELVEKQIAPVLSGVYAGKLTDLTIASTLPYLLEYKNTYGSIIQGLEANKEKFLSRSDKKFFSFDEGLHTLVNGFEHALRDVECRYEHRAISIEKEKGKYVVTFQNGEVIEADHVVLAIPHAQAEKLFAESYLSDLYSRFKSSSLISVYLGYSIPDTVLPGEGTGFITATSNDVVCNACTWTSKKWKHTSPDGNLLVRMFYKSGLANFESMKNMSDQELIGLAQEDVTKAFGIVTEPITGEVSKWNDMMPNYQLSHPNDLKQLEQGLAEHYPGVWLAGCSYYGVGIPDCMQNGKETAKRVIENL